MWAELSIILWALAVTGQAKLITNVEKEAPAIILTCSLTDDEVARSCQFLTPSRELLHHTDSHPEYSFFGEGTTWNPKKAKKQKKKEKKNKKKKKNNNGSSSDSASESVSSESSESSSEEVEVDCGIRIENATAAHLGLWRCGVEVQSGIEYDFFQVLCPWAMQDPDVAASIVTEPTLAANVSSVTALAGEPVSMSCNVQAPVRYCYFRSQNGRIYNVRPGSSNTPFTYEGAGLQAGDCGIRFSSLEQSDSGRWSCHVGFEDPTWPEQRADINLTVTDVFTVNQIDGSDQVLVQGQVYGSPELEYCIFVRIDGFGFTTENVPERYQSHTSLQNGLCSITISDPNILEHHPWTVVAKAVDQEQEVSRTTTHTIPSTGTTTTEESVDIHEEHTTTFQPPQESEHSDEEASKEPELEAPLEVRPDPGFSSQYTNLKLLWAAVALLALSQLALVSIMLFQKRNKGSTEDGPGTWETFGTSIRDSFRKKPPPAYEYSEKTPAGNV